jgi:transposase
MDDGKELGMTRTKEHVVTLTRADQATLKTFVSTGVHPARAITRARILLALDEADGPAPDRRVVAERLGVCQMTVYRVACRFEERGGRVEEAVARKKRETPPVEPKVTGDVEARIIALSKTAPPEGSSAWTLRLLERHVLLTDGIPPVGRTRIGQILKKGGSNPT